MSTIATECMSAQEFWEWACRPENKEKHFELDRGEIVEMPPPGELLGAYCSWISYLLWAYVLRRGKGYVCGNDTGLLVSKDPDVVRSPDVMLFNESRTLQSLSLKFAETVPTLIVEVLSPNDQFSILNVRINQFCKRGVPLIWAIDPVVRSVTVYRPGREHYVVDETDELTGEDVLPDLHVPVHTLFNVPGSEDVGSIPVK